MRIVIKIESQVMQNDKKDNKQKGYRIYHSKFSCRLYLIGTTSRVRQNSIKYPLSTYNPHSDVQTILNSSVRPQKRNKGETTNICRLRGLNTE